MPEEHEKTYLEIYNGDLDKAQEAVKQFAWIPHGYDYDYAQWCPACKVGPWEECILTNRINREQETKFHIGRSMKGTRHSVVDFSYNDRPWYIENYVPGNRYHSIDFPPILDKIFREYVRRYPNYDVVADESVFEIYKRAPELWEFDDDE